MRKKQAKHLGNVREKIMFFSGNNGFKKYANGGAIDNSPHRNLLRAALGQLGNDSSTTTGPWERQIDPSHSAFKF